MFKASHNTPYGLPGHYHVFPTDFEITAGCKSGGCGGGGKGKSVVKTKPAAKPYKPAIVKPKSWGKR